METKTKKTSCLKLIIVIMGRLGGEVHRGLGGGGEAFSTPPP